MPAANRRAESALAEAAGTYNTGGTGCWAEAELELKLSGAPFKGAAAAMGESAPAHASSSNPPVRLVGHGGTCTPAMPELARETRVKGEPAGPTTAPGVKQASDGRNTPPLEPPVEPLLELSPKKADAASLPPPSKASAASADRAAHGAAYTRLKKLADANAAGPTKPAAELLLLPVPLAGQRLPPSGARMIGFVGEGVGEVDGVTVGLPVGERVTVGDRVPDGVTDGLPEGETDGDTVAEEDVLNEAVTVPLPLTLLVTDALVLAVGDGVAVALPLLVVLVVGVSLTVAEGLVLLVEETVVVTLGDSDDEDVSDALALLDGDTDVEYVGDTLTLAVSAMEGVQGIEDDQGASKQIGCAWRCPVARGAHDRAKGSQKRIR